MRRELKARTRHPRPPEQTPLPHWLPPKPGTEYPTMDAAAAAAFRAAGFGTIPTGREGGGYIYQLPNGRFSFTSPVWDHEGGLSTTAMLRALGEAMVHNRDIVPVADYHNHGTDFHPGYEVFSPGDTSVTSSNHRRFPGSFVGSYLRTPTGAVHFADTAGQLRPVSPSYIPAGSTNWGRGNPPPTEMPPKGQAGGATVPAFTPQRGNDSSSRGNDYREGTQSRPAKPTNPAPQPPPGAWSAIAPEGGGPGDRWLLTWNGSAWVYVWKSETGKPPPGPAPEVPQAPQTPKDEGGDGSDGDDEGDDDDSDDSDDEDDDEDTSDEGDGEEDTTIGSGGTSAGRTVDDDGGSGGNDYEARRFHPNYLTMDERMMLAMADLAWRRGQGPRPPSGGPTDIWQPFKGKTSSAAPEVARSRGRMLEKSAFLDAALLGALGKQGSHGPSDGSDQIPLTRTVGDDAEAEAAANRDDVRRMYWKQHVEPRILSASQRTNRTG